MFNTNMICKRLVVPFEMTDLPASTVTRVTVHSFNNGMI